MRIVSSAMLILYGVLNIFAGIGEWVMVNEMPVAVNVLLVLIGGALVWAGIAFARAASGSLKTVVAALAAAFCLAMFNERILGYGHPSHHLVRGLYTAFILFAAFRAAGKVPAGS